VISSTLPNQRWQIVHKPKIPPNPKEGTKKDELFDPTRSANAANCGIFFE
jgi:hypothetical protein